MKNILTTISAIHPRTEEIDWQSAYERSLPGIFHYFCYKVGNPNTAEELTAITFEKAWKSRRNYRKDSGQVHAWFSGIARNVAADYFRKKSREVSLEDIAEPEITPAFDDDLQRRMDFQTLMTMIDRLPEREQELIAMKYGAELTNREIARITGLSETNVGTILQRTVEKLRREWEKSHER